MRWDTRLALAGWLVGRSALVGQARAWGTRRPVLRQRWREQGACGCGRVAQWDWPIARSALRCAEPEALAAPPRSACCCRLARVALKALSMPAAELRRLAELALRTEFPPRRQIARYDRAWARLHARSRKQVGRLWALGACSLAWLERPWHGLNSMARHGTAPRLQL